MQVPDDVYSNEIARRAVARAARHIGIETISEEALDVMGEVLIVYLQRVGKTLANLVEASGRTSAHVNVLDALQAAEACTAPTAKQVHYYDNSSSEEGFNNDLSSSIPVVEQQQQQQQQQQPKLASTTTGSSSWQDLAVFLFGNNWQTTQEQNTNNNSTAPSSSQAGGKVGPSMALPKMGAGWNAPYRDEVPPYPEASDRCANPHPLSAVVGASLHNYNITATELQENISQELDKMADNVFTESVATTTWGSLTSTKTGAATGVAAASNTATAGKRKRDDSEPPAEQAKAKKAKVDEENADNDDEFDDNLHPYYVPTFYPPFPEPHSGLASRTVVDVDAAPLVAESLEAAAAAAAAAAASTDKNVLLATTDVRSSLVHMGMQQKPLQQQGYWGSYPSDNAKAAVLAALRVPQGRLPEGTQGTPSAVVVPLGRASGSRVSRILEGSMDAAQIL